MLIETMQWELINPLTGKTVVRGEEVVTFRGEKCFVLSGQPPHKEGSTGRVTIADEVGDFVGDSFYPSVVNLQWVKKGVN